MQPVTGKLPVGVMASLLVTPSALTSEALLTSVMKVSSSLAVPGSRKSMTSSQFSVLPASMTSVRPEKVMLPLFAP